MGFLEVVSAFSWHIGASDFSTAQLWQSGDSLTEQPFTLRKHQAFRPVSCDSLFDGNIYAANNLAPSQYTNSRLIGRSVWNTRWLLVIPGGTLLQDADDGLERFIHGRELSPGSGSFDNEGVKDIKLLFQTYSYSGN